MADYRPDPPELPAGYFWDSHRIPTAWNRDGMPVMDLRRRRMGGLLGSVLVQRQCIGAIDHEPEPLLQDLIIEDAQRRIVARVWG